jgi:hypothetical protein
MGDSSNELQDFVDEALRQIVAGVKAMQFYKPVDFEVAVAKTTTAEGKMGIKVLGVGGVDGGGSVTTESTSKLNLR